MIVGDLIENRYEVTALLGRGRTGIVYRVRDRRTGSDLALKAVPPDADPRAGAEGLRAEYEAIARVSHPRIVRGVEWGAGWFTMEYLPGRDLASVGTLPPAEAARAGAEIAEALAHLHGLGLAHGDLTPAHAILAPGAGVRLLDLGGSVPGADGGTPGTLAPERLRGAAPDARADLYSLGALLFRLLTGRPPFRGASPTAVLLRPLSESPVPPSRVSSGVPPELDALVLSLLAKDPAARPASAAAVAERLRALAGAAEGPRLAPPAAAARFRALRERADGRANRLLAAAAVCGPAADPGHLARVAGLDAAAAAAASAALHAEGLLRGSSGAPDPADPDWSLPSEEVRAALYLEIPEEERRAVHARAAADLAASAPAGDPRLAAPLAHHRFHAGDPRGAAAALRGVPAPLPGLPAEAAAALCEALAARGTDPAETLRFAGEHHLAAGWP
ncbi:MAG: serine/threonine protein kinase, partial [Planctomycetales bacterium]|nr:serine/threonine protein kinase [Planctomycetales bacterium]